MNSNLILTSTRDMDRQAWLAFRWCGLGGSDVGTVLGLNQYKSALELFHEKTNPTPKMDYENISMFMGKFDETGIAELWEYWDGSQEIMIANYNAGTKVRRCQRVNAYVQNPKYPWLFVSLDRKINKTPMKNEGALEIKTIAGYESDKWESGIPPGHIVQVQTQILVCEFNHGELAVQKDGRQFDVYPFTTNTNIQQGIIEKTKIFWDKVVLARQLLTERYEADRNFNQRRVNEINAQLQLVEPDADGTVAYENYIKEKYKRSTEAGIILGTDEDYQLALEHRINVENKAELEDKIRLLSNRLKTRIGSMETLDFGTKGKVSWKGDDVRRFSNKIKI